MGEGVADVKAFYDELAEHYHLVYSDWLASSQRQAAALDRVIKVRLGSEPQHILDCSCGIGTQALGLAQLGHEVTGIDVSSHAIARARREAENLGLTVRLEVADLRTVHCALPDEFDVVLSCDNSLPHFLSEADLRDGIHAMFSKLRAGGLFLASLRDYDEILKERPTTSTVLASGSEGRRHLSLQLWTWDQDGRSYDLELFLLQQEAQGWSVRTFATRYRAIRREELSALVAEAGHASPTWMMPEHTQFFQPLLVGRKR